MKIGDLVTAVHPKVLMWTKDSRIIGEMGDHAVATVVGEYTDKVAIILVVFEGECTLAEVASSYLRCRHSSSATTRLQPARQR